MIKRIGFCCKYLDENGTTDDKSVNTRSTTVAWLKRQSLEVAEQRLWDLMVHNIAATHKMVGLVGEMDPSLRMCRIGSDLLPVYTEPTYSYFWRKPDVLAYCEREFAKVGELARERDVRLSFHPGQFTVLASESDDIVARSIDEFEYHVDMARWMGYGSAWHDHGFKINVHISGRRGPDGIRAALSRMTPEARNLITIENEENAHGLDAVLALADCCAIVLDLHHHWCHSVDYLERLDPRVDIIRDSWRGVRPVLHYSLSREDVVPAASPDTRPSFQQLIESGHKKAHLRAHSDFMWNRAVNQYAAEYWDEFDIQVESKAKNLASRRLYEELTCAS